MDRIQLNFWLSQLGLTLYIFSAKRVIRIKHIAGLADYVPELMPYKLEMKHIAFYTLPLPNDKKMHGFFHACGDNSTIYFEDERDKTWYMMENKL